MQHRYSAARLGLQGVEAAQRDAWLGVSVAGEPQSFFSLTVGNILDGLLVPGLGVVSGVILQCLFDESASGGCDALKLRDGREFLGKTLAATADEITFRPRGAKELSVAARDCASLVLRGSTAFSYVFERRFCRVAPCPPVPLKTGDRVKLLAGAVTRRATARTTDGRVQFILDGLPACAELGLPALILEVNGQRLPRIAEPIAR